MNMIEKVARALCWSHGMDPNISLNGDGVNFLWMEYEEHAKAAIEAMKEPDALMMNASEMALNEYIDTLPIKKQTWRVDTKTKHRLRYQSMIRAALGEK